ncbi:MAG TPA: hypothetical protein VFH06_02065 [Candidatus Saccharimonadales bacterium]|nr:hypothetical protein [Candidatus Saccharimonadales bacterium]
MKNIDLSISPEAIKKSFFVFMHRYHVILFVVVVLGGLAVSVFVLNTIVIRSSDTSDSTSGQTSGEFDQATIKRIEELKTRDQAGGGLDLSKGRTNPFVE